MPVTLEPIELTEYDYPSTHEAREMVRENLVITVRRKLILKLTRKKKGFGEGGLF